MKIKRIISVITVISLIISSLLTYPVFAESNITTLVNENFDSGAFNDTYTRSSGMGNITIEPDVSGYNLKLSTDLEGDYVKVQWDFARVTNGIFEASVDFEASDVSAGNILMALADGSNTLFAIQTKEDKIVLVNNGGENDVASSFLSGTVKISADMTSGKFDVFFNGAKVCSNNPLSRNGISAIYFAATASPGFFIDNVYAANALELSQLQISGSDTISIPLNGERSYTYEAIFTDDVGNPIVDKDFKWEITDGVTTIYVDSSSTADSINELDCSFVNNKLVVKVDSSDDIGNISVKAILAEDTSVNCFKSIILVKGNANNVAVTGDTHITATKNREFSFQYNAVSYDAQGNEMTGESFIWEVLNSDKSTPYSGSADIVIDSDGLLTISGSMPPHDVIAYVKATNNGDNTKIGYKKIVIQKPDVYYSDLYRLDAVQKSIDFILKNASNQKYDKNEEGKNPLFAAYLSPYKKVPGKVQYVNTPAVAYSDMSTNFELYRTLEGLNNLGYSYYNEFDGTYKSYQDRVDEIYQWYFDYGVTPGDNLFYMGNHRVFDLETGRVTKQNQMYDSDIPYMEIEDRDFYSAPFVKLNKDKYVTFCKSFWSNCVADWKTMVFNRHTTIDGQTDESVLGRLDEYEQNVQNGSEYVDKFIPFIGLTFMSTGNILLKTAADAYNYSNDDDTLAKNLKEWGYRFIKRYQDTAYEGGPTDGIFGTMFVSSIRASGKKSLENEFGANWWQTEEGTEAGKNYDYGDRAYNQFADTCVRYGLDSSKKEEILEGALISGERIFGRFAWECYDFAENVLGLNPNLTVGAEYTQEDADDGKKGFDVVKSYTKCIAQLITNAYNPQTNKFKTIFTNGFDVSDMKWERTGYFGRAGSKFGEWSITDMSVITMIKACETIEKIPGLDAIPENNSNPEFQELAQDRKIIWDFVNEYLRKKYSIGYIDDIDDNIPGGKPALKTDVKASSPGLIRILIGLYNSADDTDTKKEFLNLARIVGNNLVNTQFKNGMFISDSKLRYTATETESQYALLLIEQAILEQVLNLGEHHGELLPESSYPNAYEYQLDSYSMVNNAFLDWVSPELLTWRYRDVLVTDIIPYDKEIRIKVGETAAIDLTIKPDDATSKSIYWEIGNRNLVSINEQNTVYGLSKGETTVIAVSKSTLDVESEPIKIIVE